MPHFIIDRFEGEDAFLQTPEETSLRLPRQTLPEDAREGDLLTQNSDGAYRIDREATAARREKMERRLRRLLGEK